MPVKIATPVIRIGRRPYISESFPASGTVTVVVSIYAVITNPRLEKLLNSLTIAPSDVEVIV